ncbi:hypothetical protein CY35_17G059200 [Sphagnum magellanicum]|nr:hypothetical protein CY35_17G059200 [Sphagnum magellanicum]
MSIVSDASVLRTKRVATICFITLFSLSHKSLVTNLTNQDLLVTLSVDLAKRYLYHLIDSERLMYIAGQTWDGASDLWFLPLEKGNTIC